MLRVEVTPELAALIAEIDRLKCEIAARPPLSETVLQRLEAEFIEDTIYHGMRLDAWTEGRT